jgi:hypothetical protein
VPENVLINMLQPGLATSHRHHPDDRHLHLTTLGRLTPPRHIHSFLRANLVGGLSPFPAISQNVAASETFCPLPLASESLTRKKVQKPRSRSVLNVPPFHHQTLLCSSPNTRSIRLAGKPLGPLARMLRVLFVRETERHHISPENLRQMRSS